MTVVSDTSALSNLALIDHLWVLEAIYQTVIIPEVVASELAVASNPTISAILKLDWIQTQALSNSQLANQLQQERGLDAGEANAIALALESQLVNIAPEPNQLNYRVNYKLLGVNLEKKDMA